MVKISKLNKVFLGLFIFSSHLGALGPDYIKETYLPVAEDFRHISPINGAMWWEGDIVRNYYEYGILSPTANKKDWLPAGDGPPRLVHALFNIVQGSFGTSQNKSYPAAHLSANTIAQIIALLEQHRLESIRLTSNELENALEKVIITDPDFQRSVAETKAEYKKISALYGQELSSLKGELTLLKKKEKPLQVDGLEKRIKDLQVALNSELSKYDVSRLYDPNLPAKLGKIGLVIDTGQRNLSNIVSQLATAKAAENKKLIGKLYRQKEQAEKKLEENKGMYEKNKEGRAGYRRVRELAQAIVDAYNADLDIYPRYSVYSILTAFMYRKAANKEAFEGYFNILNQQLGTLFKPEDGWLTNNFQKDALGDIETSLQKWLTRPDIEEFVGNLYEKAVYGQTISRFYKGELPKIAAYRNVFFEGTEFSDCAETTMRNLCNIILYDQPNGLFILSQAPSDNLDPAFRDFYEKYKHAVDVEKQEVHQAWESIIENQPWVAYNKMIDTSGLVKKAPFNTNGFIIIPAQFRDAFEIKDGNIIEIAGREYVLIDGSAQKGFEVQPSVRNIIILLNHFFGLNLFENKDIATEFKKANFNATYLSELANEFQRMWGLKYDRATVDSNDYTVNAVDLFFSGFSINLTRVHASLKIDLRLTNIINLPKDFIQNVVENFTNSIATFPFSQFFSIYPLPLKQFTPALFPLIYFLRLSDNETRVDLVGYLDQVVTGNQKIQKASKDLMLIIVKKLLEQPDLVYFNRAINAMKGPLDQAIVDYMLEFAQKTPSLEKKVGLLGKLIEKGYEKAYDETLKTAIDAVKSNDYGVRMTGLRLFKKLIEKGYEKAYDEALKAAIDAAKEEARAIKIYGLSLLKELAEKGYAVSKQDPRN